MMFLQAPFLRGVSRCFASGSPSGRLCAAGLCAALLLLSGCTSLRELVDGTSYDSDARYPAYLHGSGGEARVDLLAVVNESADSLHAALKEPLALNRPVLAATFVDLSDLTQTSALGRTLTEGYVARLSRYPEVAVKDVRLRSGSLFVQPAVPGAGGGRELALSRELSELAAEHEAYAVLAGTYTVAGGELYISARLLRLSDGQLLAADAYVLPLTGNLRALAAE